MSKFVIMSKVDLGSDGNIGVKRYDQSGDRYSWFLSDE
jgi:hypothetical protein